MADYTFHSLVEPLKNNSTIQTILDVNALAAPAKAALAAYVASLGLPAAETQHLTWENVGVAVLIRSLALTYYLPSLGAQTPAADVKRTSSLRDRVTEMQKLQSAYPKCQLLIYGKTAPTSDWVWLNTEVIQNSGNQVNTLKLLPYINQMEDFAPGRGCAIGIQFIADAATKATLPQAGDRITAQGSVFLDVNPIAGESKKNDEVEQLKSRLAALEALLQPFGAATASVAGTAGLVQGAAAGESEYLLRGDRTWQNPLEFVNSLFGQVINGLKTFSATVVSNKAISAQGSDNLSLINSTNQATMFATGGGAYLSLSAPSAPPNAKIIDFGIYPTGTASIRRINDTYNTVAAPVVDIDSSGTVRAYRFSTGRTIFTRIISESFTINPASIGPGAHQLINLTVSGAMVGDFCHVAPVGIELLTTGIWPFQFTAVVTATNQVSLYLVNQWTGALDLGVFQVRVLIMG